ncbi:hypothetical protein DCS_00849 [Drechmeria coniospora]|uniref:DNA mismatch repair protein PMS1 n=1 Tax=Drechmeria coniospora TaxID=98403 RepID=A0A151GRH8_DRECN|nr:hypothetical protein DCS_00849 [Drechmeria coniospora]KYK59715.1 hypothetical protein DCS_00849 [Drechmeria coniospora]
MAASILPIDSRSVHQIQSGQVIVDLCSVVKELVENSVDAGATTIGTVIVPHVPFSSTLLNQGLELIEVQDNGSGIAPANYASVALKHHTSKLSSYSDIASLQTFGFRGEALASLCALSSVHVTTCLQADAPKGSRLAFESSGALRSTEVVATQKGTTVSVESLFHSLPVRRRELERNIKREWHKVIALLNQYACIQTNLKFSVSQQPTKDLKLELQPSAAGHGLAVPTPDKQMFFINGRPCALPQFAKAFNEVYRSFNHTQSPFIFADIQLDTHMYDVNVSPDKRSIFLHDQGRLLDNVRSSLTALFDSHDHSVPISRLAAEKPKHLDSTSTMSGQNKVAPVMNQKSESKRVSLRRSSARSLQSSIDDIDDDDNDDISNDGDSSDDSDIDSRETSGGPKSATTTSASRRRIEPDQNLISQWLNNKDSSVASRHSSSLSNSRQASQALSVEPSAVEQETSISSTQTRAMPGRNRSQLPRPVQDFNDRLAGKSFVGATTTSDAMQEVSSNSTMASNVEYDAPAAPTRSENQLQRSKLGNPLLLADTAVAIENNMNSSEDNPETMENILLNINRRNANSGREVLSSRPMQDFAEHTLASLDPVDANANSRKSPPGPICSPSDLHEHDRGSRLESGGGRDAESDADAQSPPPGSSNSSNNGDSTGPSPKRSKSVGVRAKRGSTAALASQIVRMDEKTLSFLLKDVISRRSTENVESNEDDGVDDITAPDAESKLPLIISRSDFSKMRVVGQFNMGFIIAVRPAAIEDDDSQKVRHDEIFIIDQHASDEKYNFERLQATTTVQSQRLVHPKRLELTSLEEEIIMENLASIEANGFKVDVDTTGDSPAGSRCQLLALPLSRETTFSLDDLEELISLLADEPYESGRIPRPSKVRKMFAMRACRSSIMIGKALTYRQMKALLTQMGQLDKPWNCPHGRPTMRHLCRAAVLDDRVWSGDAKATATSVTNGDETRAGQIPRLGHCE